MNKQITTILTALLLFATAIVNAQAPQGFNYQAVVRDANGSIITGGPVTLNFTIRQGTTGGTTRYSETHSINPNQYGQVTAVIGTGTVVTGNFSTISWGTDKFFIETKVNGNTVSNTQFQSVPYALSTRDWVKRSGGQPTLACDSNVFVGIGTIAPAKPLEISHVTSAFIRLTSQTAVESGLELIRGTDADSWTDWQVKNSLGNFRVYPTCAGCPSLLGLYIRSDGNVGIGVGPQFPLHVAGTGTHSIMTTPADESWFNPSGGFQIATNSQTGAVTIYAEGFIASGVGFVAHSDTRLKNITGISNQAEDLRTLNKIQVTDYTMRDSRANNGAFKKVIAQQVKEVYPQAVMNIGAEQYVANLYQLAPSYTANSNTLTFTLPEPIEEKDKNDVVQGACIKFYMREKHDALCMKMVEGEITAIKGNTYTVAPNEYIDATVYDKVFVYGTKVNNVLAVDYDALGMLNISATQELAKEVETLKAQNSLLTAANENLKAELQAVTTSLKADMELVKSQLGIRSQVAPK